MVSLNSILGERTSEWAIQRVSEWVSELEYVVRCGRTHYTWLIFRLSIFSVIGARSRQLNYYEITKFRHFVDVCLDVKARKAMGFF